MVKPQHSLPPDELKRRAEEALAEAQRTIAKARQLAVETQQIREAIAELELTRA